MTDIPDFRPSDTITNPWLFELARQRWPGQIVKFEMLSGIAMLEKRPLHVPATPEAVAIGLREVAAEQRRARQQAATAAEYRRMNFDPSLDYRSPTTATTKE